MGSKTLVKVDSLGEESIVHRKVREIHWGCETRWWQYQMCILFFKHFIYLHLEEGKGGRKRWREPSVWERLVASRTPPDGDLAHNPGMCPAWESNQRTFSSQASAQSTEPHYPGPDTYLKLPNGRPIVQPPQHASSTSSESSTYALSPDDL